MTFTVVNPLITIQDCSIEPRHPRARRDLPGVRFIIDELNISSEIIELLIERQLATQGMLVRVLSCKFLIVTRHFNKFVSNLC